MFVDLLSGCYHNRSQVQSDWNLKLYFPVLLTAHVWNRKLINT